MTDPVHMDFEEPPHPYDAAPRARGGKKSAKKRKRTPQGIPQLPQRPAFTGDEIKQGVSTRSRAAANLRVEGYSFLEIAEMLEFPDARAAQRAVEAVLAAVHGDSDLESLRIIAAARAERLVKQSLAMAGADYLVVKGDDGTEERVPNRDKLRWHQQAAIDVQNWAAITGAKAPTKLEITPGEAEYDKIVDRLLRASGQDEIVDAEVIELDAIEAPVEAIFDPDEDDDDDEGP